VSDATGLLSAGNLLAFIATAGLVYEIIAACCSSPQTAEINARARSATLMKWVKIGLVQAAFFVLIAVSLAQRDSERYAAIAGGVLAGVVMWLSYVYANRAGLANGAPGTESY
jgi:hypothetical protein